ncbi:MAG: outer membrane protein assembly factor BamA [Victivallaceae bacterium]
MTLWKITLISLAGLLLVPAAFSAKIGKLEFVQTGGYQFPEKMLQFNVQQKPGLEYDENIMNADIKRLYETGFFSDVVSETKKISPDKVDVIIKVSVKPRVKAIVFKGNVKFSTEDLKNEITLASDMPLNDNKLRESAQKLRDFYKSKGYNDATITPVLNSLGKDEINITFDIQENLRLKVDNVSFEGATVYSQYDLKNAIANRHSYLSRFLEFGMFNRDELENDKARIRELYWNKGYLDFKVEGVTVTQQKDDAEYVNIKFKLFEGKPYTVGKISVAGNNIFPKDQLLKLIKLQTGKTFDNQLETDSKNSISNLYESMGYADFFCKVVRIPDFNTHVVDLDFIVTEGKKYKVKDVIISGNLRTKDKVIRRELAIQPGDPLDKNRIQASKSRLMGMGYFEDVKAVSVSTDEVGQKNVNFDVKEKETFKVKVGGGFSDTDSLVGMVEVGNSNFDIMDPMNYFYGGGQRFRVQGMFGIERQGVNIDFTEPWLMDMPLRLDVSGYANKVEYEHWDESRIGGKTSLTHKVFDDFTSLTGGYKFEQVNVNDISSTASPYLRSQGGHDWVSQFSVLLNRDTRDSLLEPTSGYLTNGSAALASKVIGSSNNFYRLESKDSYYFSLLEKALVFHLGGKIGTISAFDRNDQVPIYERYFLGGGDSIRGFPYRNVSPVDVNGDNIGGQSMLLLTAEMTHPIWSFIRGAIFVDAGNAWWQSYSYGMSGLNSGAGYGLRIKVPYLNAPVKLDLAYPILSNQSDLSRKLRFHFNMGFTW